MSKRRFPLCCKILLLCGMIAAYSSDYEEVGAECIYQKADTQLCFILQDDVIISIEYRIADENAF